MSTSAEQTKTFRGPVILSYGFRPFFLAASAWAVIAMLLWISMLSGRLTLPSNFDVVAWHAHELIYGYLAAVIAGFLLTAIPNWTGRLPVRGVTLLGLALVWGAGRLSMLCGSELSSPIVAAIDLSFLVLLAIIVGREIVAGKNWRNLKVLFLIALLATGNAISHAEAANISFSSAAYSSRFGIAIAITFIMLIGGRIIPSFTRNWLAGQNPGPLPTLFNRYDAVSITLSVAGLVFWVVAPNAAATGLLCLLASIGQTIRLFRWFGFRAFSEPLVWILHLGYGFVPIGFLVVGLAILVPDAIAMNTAIHAWSAGAIGVMTLAVMTRASLGHVGKPLHADGGTVTIYLFAIAAVCLRIAADYSEDPALLLDLAAGSWIAAFTGYAIHYGPLLAQARRQ